MESKDEYIVYVIVRPENRLVRHKNTHKIMYFESLIEAEIARDKMFKALKNKYKIEERTIIERNKIHTSEEAEKVE